MEVKVKMSGLKEIEGMLNMLPSGVGRTQMRKALRLAARPGVNEAKSNLRASWWDSRKAAGKISAKDKKGLRTGESSVYVSTDKSHRYASFYEHGTKHLRADPWLIPAFEGSKDKMRNLFIRTAAITLEKYMSKLVKRIYKTGKVSKRTAKTLGL